MNYKYGNNFLGSFYGDKFYDVKNRQELGDIKVCDNFIWTISSVEYQNDLELINKISVRKIYVIVDTIDNIDVTITNPIDCIRLDLLLNLKHKTDTRNFFVIKKQNDWIFAKHVIDSKMIGFDACSDAIYLVVALLIIIFTFVPTLIKLYC